MTRLQYQAELANKRDEMAGNKSKVTFMVLFFYRYFVQYLVLIVSWTKWHLIAQITVINNFFFSILKVKIWNRALSSALKVLMEKHWN